MYRIKLDKVQELRHGRTNIYLAELTGFTKEYVCHIMSGKRNMEARGLKRFLVPVCQEITSLNEMLNNEGYEKIVEYFFDVL